MEPVKITEEHIKEINLIIASIEALDEHVQMQIKARGMLVGQRKDWWEKMRVLYNLDTAKGALYLDQHKGVIKSKADEDKKEV